MRLVRRVTSFFFEFLTKTFVYNSGADIHKAEVEKLFTVS